MLEGVRKQNSPKLGYGNHMNIEMLYSCHIGTLLLPPVDDLCASYIHNIFNFQKSRETSKPTSLTLQSRGTCAPILLGGEADGVSKYSHRTTLLRIMKFYYTERQAENNLSAINKQLECQCFTNKLPWDYNQLQR
jgi:hypothetical protein